MDLKKDLYLVEGLFFTGCVLSFRTETGCQGTFLLSCQWHQNVDTFGFREEGEGVGRVLPPLPKPRVF